ncbi:MAG: tetratricopeptide repeat protein [Candidatus Acidiferrum sp.]|jgi:TPR repeat protein
MVTLFRLLTRSLALTFPLLLQFSALFPADATPLAQNRLVAAIPVALHGDTPQPQATAPSDAAALYKHAYSIIYDARRAPDYESALGLLRSAAAQHFAPAQFLLGYLYEHGRGVSVDYGQAADNYRAAAQQGHAGAENNLGGLYQYGHGVPRDINRAFECYHASAQHGNAMGQYNLGTFYRLGYGTAPDMGLAVKWFRVAAEQGLAVAEANMALFYFNGEGVPVDYGEAAHWSRLAAEQGLPHAATNYAYLCEQGKGVPRDYVAAYLWYSRAIAAGDKTAVAPLKSVAHHLSRAQINQAKTQLAADSSRPQQPDAGGANADLSLIVSP